MSIDFNKALEEVHADKNRFYLLLSGDKDFKPYESYAVCVNNTISAMTGEEYAFMMVDKILTNRFKDNATIRIVTGDNAGIDKIAKDYAERRSMDSFEFWTDWDSHGNKAGFIRNQEMFYHIARRPNKACILFWNGDNIYTKNLIYLAYHYQIAIRVFNYVTKKWLSQNEIESIGTTEEKNQIRYFSG